MNLLITKLYKFLASETLKLLCKLVMYIELFDSYLNVNPKF